MCRIWRVKPLMARSWIHGLDSRGSKRAFREEAAMAIVDLESPAEAPTRGAPTVEAQAPRWEVAECTCPDPCCERDHEQD
jgi:hypothetical protein